MSSFSRSLKELPVRLLRRVNALLSKTTNPDGSSAMSKSTNGRTSFLNPALGLKKCLQFANNELLRLNSKPNRDTKWRWTLGLIAVAAGLLVGYWEDLQWISPQNLYRRHQETLHKSMVANASNLIDHHVLKNGKVMSELDKLLYSICIAVNVAHLTTENINKLLAMESLRKDASHLTNLLLIRKVFQELAEEKLKLVVVLVLRKDSNREFLQHQILSFLGGEFFQGFIIRQFRQLMLGQAFQQFLSDTATGTIRGNLKSVEFKQEIYRYIKQRLM